MNTNMNMDMNINANIQKNRKKHRKLKDFNALDEIHSCLENYDDIIVNLDKNAFPIHINFIIP